MQAFAGSPYQQVWLEVFAGVFTPAWLMLNVPQLSLACPPWGTAVMVNVDAVGTMLTSYQMDDPPSRGELILVELVSLKVNEA